MKAAADAQHRLLELQAVDTAIAQLDHRAANLPETARARALQAERAAASERLIAAETVAGDRSAEVDRAEADLGPVRERLARNRKRVDDGSIVDPKALTSMLEEIEHLGRRIGDLEDLQLEAMERLDAAREAAARAEASKTEIENRLRAVLQEREAALAAIAGERAERTLARDALAAAVPADLLALYHRVAEKRDGVGAAPLRHRRCGGCQLEATTADLTRYRAAADDEVLRCEECSRILVRTAESGL